MTDTQIPAIDPGALNRATRAADQAVEAVLAVHALLLSADAAREAPDPAELLAAAEDANHAAQRSFQILSSAGGRSEGMPPRKETPLHLLATKNSRGLLDTLRIAQEWAEEVDRERDNVLPADFPLLPGESRGTGWAETISELVERLRVEVEGPRGRRGE